MDLNNLPGYADADELRVVNNKIKHLGTVDAELAAFGTFQGKLGRRLLDLDLDMHRYSLGIHAFLDRILEDVEALP